MITLYTKPACADCVFMKRYLQHKNIPYTEADIFSEEARKVVAPTGLMTAPLININGKILPASRGNIINVSEELKTWTESNKSATA